MNHQNLTGKVIIITGASSGIGAATARAVAAQGASVVLAARSADRLAALRDEIGSERAFVVPVDVAKGPDVLRMVSETIEHFGHLDVLFANAGQYAQKTIAEGDIEAYAQLINVNVTGVLRCIHAVLPHMIAQHSGDILVTASISSHADIDGEAVYSASKHAVMTLVNILRREAAPHGIRVGAISPGLVLNELWGMTNPDAIERDVEARRGLRSEDVAELVVQMLSLPARITLRDVVVLAQGQII